MDGRFWLKDHVRFLMVVDAPAATVESEENGVEDRIVGEVILNQFRELGVRVIAADGGTELTVGDHDPTRTLIRQVLGAVAQFEKAVVVSKLKATSVSVALRAAVRAASPTARDRVRPTWWR
ncbi:MAG: hypothetical protein ACHQ9S_22390 [Candidatus Binatia bacterium]